MDVIALLTGYSSINEKRLVILSPFIELIYFCKSLSDSSKNEPMISSVLSALSINLEVLLIKFSNSFDFITSFASSLDIANVSSFGF